MIILFVTSCLRLVMLHFMPFLRLAILVIYLSWINPHLNRCILRLIFFPSFQFSSMVSLTLYLCFILFWKVYIHQNNIIANKNWIHKCTYKTLSYHIQEIHTFQICQRSFSSIPQRIPVAYIYCNMSTWFDSHLKSPLEEFVLRPSL